MSDIHDKKNAHKENNAQEINETLLSEDSTNEKKECENSDCFDEEKARELLCPQCSVAQEAEELRLRTFAEMDNFKKRIQREKEEQAKYASENVLQDIIPALDNLDLALQYANNEACQDIVMGIKMTRKLLMDSLKNHGLEAIDGENIPFNPEIHEAVAQETSQEIPQQHIIRTLQKGYMLKDRLLRPAKVLISN